MDENFCKYICSVGFQKSCDIYMTNNINEEVFNE